MTTMWAGMVAQDDGLVYSMSLTKRDERLEVSYPNLGCSGVLQQVSLVAGVLRCVEHIEQGTGNCVEGIGLAIHNWDSPNLNIEFFKDDRLVAKGTLVTNPSFP